MQKRVYVERFFDILAMASGEPRPWRIPAGETLRVGFSWKAKAEYAFFYLAKSRGFYSGEKLEVVFCEGTGSPAALDALHRGELDILILPCTFALTAIEGGAPIKIVSLYQAAAPVCLISRSQCPVALPKQLEGKRVAKLSGETGTAFLARFCEDNQVNYDRINFVDVSPVDKIGSFLRGDVDVVSVYRTNELHVLESMANFPLTELDVAAFGLHLPGMCAVASDATIGAMAELVDRFLSATRKAILAGLEERSALINVARQMPGAHPDAGIVAAQIRELVATINCLEGSSVNVLAAAHEPLSGWEAAN
ncbi:NitT/TauT family transport system substrate-binding protein [Neorhizobium galegae]|uniref:ABC transporter substrate-binding protein n=1 Tax=Neorhizobium galegae TaxID=399 RepID=UPI00277DE77B|nr:ABC transporter substrate-binding protein [Neorhizobium galegae]MDQ0134833.1 NitT/TauT family transport system substrate-binding protein [Neorhizobium galegae]